REFWKCLGCIKRARHRPGGHSIPSATSEHSLDDPVESSDSPAYDTPFSSETLTPDDQLARVDRHSHNRVDMDGIQRIVLFLRSNSPCHDQVLARTLSKLLRGFKRKSRQQTLRIDVRVQEAGNKRVECIHHRLGCERRLFGPSPHRNFSAARIDGRHNSPLARLGKLAREVHVWLALANQRRSKNYASRSQLQQLSRGVFLCDSSAHLARQPFQNSRNERTVVPLPLGRIQVDQLHQRKFRELLTPGIEVRRLVGFCLALYELHNVSAHQINRWNQHPNLIGIPSAARDAFSAFTSWMPK